MKTLTPRKPRPSMASRSGFTLTELLIVMAILVLLVSLVGPRLLGSKKKADVNAVKTQIGMFQSALERYAIDMNTFPSDQHGLQALVAKPGGGAGDSIDASFDDLGDDLALNDGSGESAGGGNTSNWDGPYLKQTKLPKDSWGNGYSYAYPPKKGDTDVPDIWSFGPDGKENTEDDIVSWTGTKSGGDIEGGGASDELVSSTD
jgi:general secretion pathway protein G